MQVARIYLKHLKARMTPFIQILTIYHLAWHVVTQLMAALILIKTQGKLPLPEQFNFIIGLNVAYKLSFVLTHNNMFS